MGHYDEINEEFYRKEQQNIIRKQNELRTHISEAVSKLSKPDLEFVAWIIDNISFLKNIVELIKKQLNYIR